MSGKDNSPLAGFSAAVGELQPGLGSLKNEKEFNENSDIPEVDPEEITGKKEETEEETTEVTTKEKKEETTADEEVSSLEDDTEDETEIVTPFVDLFTQELGWEMGDDEKPKTITELVAYMNDIIEANSKPSYASDDIEKLNKYVEEGGDIKTYFSDIFGDGIDPESIDLSKENNQKLVVTKNLEQKGYSEDRIKKMVSRYEDAGTLEDEAEDALELLKEFKEKRKEQLLKDQEKVSQVQKKQQLDFVKNVEGTVKGLTSIRGIPISLKEKQTLLDYVFKPTSDGRTSYQKDYEKNHLNLIESAYFTMKGDALLKKIETKATSDAARTLKEKLKPKSTTKPGRNTRDIEAEDSLSLFDLAASHLHKPQNFNFN
jgi:hypothetical protein